MTEKDFYDSDVKITSLAEQKRISESTKGQVQNKKWFEERKN